MNTENIKTADGSVNYNTDPHSHIKRLEETIGEYVTMYRENFAKPFKLLSLKHNN